MRPHGVDPRVEPLAFSVIGEEYVRQIVDITPGQRKRFLSQVRTLVSTEIRGGLPFARFVTEIGEPDVKAWLIDWDRALKTKANYDGLMYGVFNYALEQGFLTLNPCARTAPKRKRVKQSQVRRRCAADCCRGPARRAPGTSQRHRARRFHGSRRLTAREVAQSTCNVDSSPA